MKSKRAIIIVFLSISFLVGVLNAPVFAERNYLFQWDEGEGTTMPGWTWSDDVAYGHPGWTLNLDGPLGGGGNSSWGYGPRCFEMGGSTGGAIASIDRNRRSPNTSSGGALKIADDDLDAHFPAWWLWYDYKPLSARSITDSNTNRMSFYIYLNGTDANSSSKQGSTFHVGTYLCEYTGLPAYGTGDGCPFEGPGNQHYYHYLYYSPGGWIHTELDQHPTHLRDSFVSGNDPATITTDPNMHYMEHLHQFYMQTQGTTNPVEFYLDEMYFYSTFDATECAEPNQNEDSITSLWVGYWPDTNKWQIGWQDMSFSNSEGLNLNDNTFSTFEIRWSPNPITNANYNNANVVTPDWFTGPSHTSFPNGIRRQSAWYTRAWTQFSLPENTEGVYSKLYFAVKDVSVLSGNAGTSWPYTNPDGHDAPSSLIRTIDYYIPHGSPGLPTITGPSDFSTTSASVEIEGTYTVDSELTADTVTWTLGESSGFCVAALGVFSCTVPVDLGTNNILFEITDSNSGTANDSITITRTIPGEYTTRGDGYTIKGCSLK